MNIFVQKEAIKDQCYQIFKGKNLIEMFFKKVKGTHQIEMQEEHVIDTLNNENTGIIF